MKKNLLSIIILAVLVIDLVLTAIVMFSTTGAMNKTSKLVTDIATALSLELEADKQADENGFVPISDTEVYDVPDKMTITLLPGEDGKAHYCVVRVALSINTKHTDYKELNPKIAQNVSRIKSIINEVICEYTYEEALSSSSSMKKEILKEIQELFGSAFVFDVDIVELTIS